MELVFVIDSSESVGPDNYNIVKEFVTTLVDRVTIGRNATRVGLVLYSHEVSQFYLQIPKTKVSHTWLQLSVFYALFLCYLHKLSDWSDVQTNVVVSLCMCVLFTCHCVLLCAFCVSIEAYSS